MTRLRSIAVAVVGLSFVALGLSLSIAVARTGRVTSPGVTFLFLLVALVALPGALWKIRGSLDATSAAPVAWASDEPFANPAPERTATDHPLSSEGFARAVGEAGTEARDRTLDDGIALIRSVLRDALIEALERGGRSPEAVRRALAEGTWTDDRVAASVLDEAVAPPERSLRERVRAWLFPERVLRRRAGRAAQAVAEAADEALPTVPGQNAPRTVPVAKPRLEDLRRAADGSLQRAADPRAAARGPGPIDPGLGDERSERDRKAGREEGESESKSKSDGDELGSPPDEAGVTGA